LQNSPEAVSLLYDFAEALGWQVDRVSAPAPQAAPVSGSNASSGFGGNSPSRNTHETVKIGDIYRFGKYDWRVLDVQNGKALLLSDKVIEERAYHNSWEETTWAECDLRAYLNGEFYNSFGQDKSRIAETTNSNPNNPWYGTNGGGMTTDRVFLLSLDELVKYFGDSGDLRNKKRYVWESGKWVSASNGYVLHDQYDNARIAEDTSGKACWWWLRSPGFGSKSAALVYDDGSVAIHGVSVHIGYGVRPALFLNL
jgi:hypothetical protein